jgi:hypothetical protein
MIHRQEKTLRKHIHLKELAHLAHEVLLSRDIFDPLAMVCTRRRPQRHLVELASQVHKRDQETAFPPPSDLAGRIGGYGYAWRSPLGLEQLWRGREETTGSIQVSSIAMRSSSSGIGCE